MGIEENLTGQDWLFFTNQLVDSLAWPILIGFLFWWFKDPVSKLIQDIKSLKYKAWEATFERKLEKLGKEVELRPKADLIKKLTPQENFLENRFEKLLEISPNTSILEAWLEIEDGLRKLAEIKGYSLKRGSSGLYLVRILTRDKILPSSLSNTLDELRNLRNEVVHSPPNQQVSIDTARIYKEISNEIKSRLDALIEKT